MNARRLLQILMALSVVGWVNALYTLWHRNNLLLKGLDSKSFCNINSFVNCDAVAISSYSSLFGFPTAAFGMVFYSIVFIFCVALYFKNIDGEESNFAAGAKLLLFFNLIGLVPTLGLAALSLIKLNSLCLMCLLTYIINLIMTWVAFGLYKTVYKNAGNISAALKSLGPATWAFVIGATALHLIAPKMIDDTIGGGAKLDDPTIQLYVDRHHSSQAHSFNIDSLTPTKGPENAPITVVEFSDFQCPFCAKAAATIPVLLKAYEGKIRYAYKNFPLSSECNAGMKSNNHPLACLAAKTGVCVFKLKGSAAFFEYKEAVFLKQKELSNTVIRNTAMNAGIEEASLNTCLADPATHDTILAQTAEGSAKEVQGTPAIFVNGKIVESGPQPTILRAVLDSYLKK